MHKKLTEVPVSIKAKNAEDLTKEMLRINVMTNHWNKFFDIQKENDEWIAWFYYDVIQLKKDIVNE